MKIDMNDPDEFLEVDVHFLVDADGRHEDGRVWKTRGGPKAVMGQMRDSDARGRLSIVTATYRLTGFSMDPNFSSRVVSR